MKLAVLLAVLGLAATGHAFKCYSCTSTKEIAGVDVGSVLNFLSGTPSCTDFDPNNPDKKFETECSAVSKACVKVVDPKDSKNQMRGCFPIATDECKDNKCICSTDLCNGSERGWPSALLLLAALAAALVGGR